MCNRFLGEPCKLTRKPESLVQNKTFVSSRKSISPSHQRTSNRGWSMDQSTGDFDTLDIDFDAVIPWSCVKFAVPLLSQRLFGCRIAPARQVVPRSAFAGQLLATRRTARRFSGGFLFFPPKLAAPLASRAPPPARQEDSAVASPSETGARGWSPVKSRKLHQQTLSRAA